MKLTAAHEPPGDVGRLQFGAFRGRMGSEIAGDGDEDMSALVGIAPLAKLPHAGVQHLVGMETCVLAQERPRQRGEQRLHRVTKREMPRDETRGEIDLSLSIEDIEQSNADLVRIGGQVIERLAVIARNAGWRYIEIASKVERHRSVQDSAEIPQCSGHICELLFLIFVVGLNLLLLLNDWPLWFKRMGQRRTALRVVVRQSLPNLRHL
jgi:hypothetical protein